ncbi:hypothetical protein [Paraburkholderia susongensis]|uniref:PAAR motif-containing protein n=1 Tax=Paraburkholderia susongensis TaxID=1515439 RepID=A0A1X7LWN6_9BURK|nr:hypothetical protein [Paraburkholderia susongensis]SMG57877.1 hypothetical protein SAMN06265784_11094 [Paraburkholderia susongensis]
MAHQKHKGTLPALATFGACKENDGRATRATCGLSICGLTVARVGDVVIYSGGSEAAIIDDAGMPEDRAGSTVIPQGPDSVTWSNPPPIFYAERGMKMTSMSPQTAILTGHMPSSELIRSTTSSQGHTVRYATGDAQPLRVYADRRRRI